MEEVRRLQKVLLLVRRSVGWTAEEFGERIGVTRQTINNLESGRNNLTKTQYIAMRSVTKTLSNIQWGSGINESKIADFINALKNNTTLNEISEISSLVASGDDQSSAAEVAAAFAKINNDSAAAELAKVIGTTSTSEGKQSYHQEVEQR